MRYLTICNRILSDNFRLRVVNYWFGALDFYFAFNTEWELKGLIYDALVV